MVSTTIPFIFLCVLTFQVDGFSPYSTTRRQSLISTVPDDRRLTMRTTPTFLSLATVNTTSIVMDPPNSRFDRTANREMRTEEECILLIDGKRYNMTAWAKAHPGGVNVLRKFHNKDASKAFHASAHSSAAYAMLQEFEIVNDEESSLSLISPTSSTDTPVQDQLSITTSPKTSSLQRKRPRWQQKLFTKEDPIGVHKYLGIFCLLVSRMSVKS